MKDRHLTMTAAELRAEAARSRDASEASFQRSDTDGFLSQWAHDISAQLYERQADLVDAGGVATFPGLFRLSDGKRHPAKAIDTRYGRRWAEVDPTTDRFTGRFFPYRPRRPATLAKYGFEERDEVVRAKAVLHAPGRGLSGCASARVIVVRCDRGYPAAEVTP